MRALADQADDTVLDHIPVMEQTGLADFDQVPQVVLTPPASGSASPAAG
ncbi:hypothetical protein GCM10010129_37810 [Streptomyces fumigatiscleroticus]|nr:hypothetical protein GCM10010129_37810 [Streptomyces fumigatiscleroticus]